LLVSSVSFQRMPVSRIAITTSGSPVEYFQAESARMPEICAHSGSPSEVLTSRPCWSSCEQSSYSVAAVAWGPSSSFAESGLKPNSPYCSWV
jgi:hypothetical protein